MLDSPNNDATESEPTHTIASIDTQPTPRTLTLQNKTAPSMSLTYHTRRVNLARQFSLVMRFS